MTQKQVALALKLPVNHISDIVHGRRRITADTALRLARYFEMSAHFWLGLQTDYDLDVAEDAIGEKLDQEVAVFDSNQEFSAFD